MLWPNAQRSNGVQICISSYLWGSNLNQWFLFLCYRRTEIMVCPWSPLAMSRHRNGLSNLGHSSGLSEIWFLVLKIKSKDSTTSYVPNPFFKYTLLRQHVIKWLNCRGWAWTISPPASGSWSAQIMGIGHCAILSQILNWVTKINVHIRRQAAVSDDKWQQI